jgi:hypothetical protein
LVLRRLLLKRRYLKPEDRLELRASLRHRHPLLRGSIVSSFMTVFAPGRLNIQRRLLWMMLEVERGVRHRNEVERKIEVVGCFANASNALSRSPPCIHFNVSRNQVLDINLHQSIATHL